MSPDLRKAVEGRGRLGDFVRSGFYQAEIIFARAGYSEVTALRETKENARAFSIQNLRKMAAPKGPTVAVRLVLGHVEVFHMEVETEKTPGLAKSKFQTKWPGGKPRWPNWPES